MAGKDMMFVMPRKSAINLLEKIEGDMTTYAAKLPGGAGTCEIFFAEQLGPATSGNFSRFFQRRFGCIPRDWIRLAITA